MEVKDLTVYNTQKFIHFLILPINACINFVVIFLIVSFTFITMLLKPISTKNIYCVHV